MGENENIAGLNRCSAPRRLPFNLLLLAGNDDTWTRAVQNAAHSIGGVSLHKTYSVNEAMTHLVLGDPNFSHFLVKSDVAGDRLGELAKLTAGESHGRTRLVMLGADGAIPRRSAVVRQADDGSITQAIVSSDGRRPGAVAPLRLEELEAALAGAQLHTRYQPIVRIADRLPVGLEVLARLDHPDHGTLTPAHFIPQMEHAGLSRRLTEGVIECAFAEHAAHLQGLDLWLALNFPLDVLMDEPALGWLEAHRLSRSIPADRLVIELTESRPVDALDETGLAVLRRSISRLRGLGYGLAIDDVGPAVRNHKALFELDFTAVKLDKGLVAQAGTNDSARSFLSETIALARKAGFSVVAEGVKDEDTWERMEAAGADQAQGYLVARPLPAAAVPVWLQAWKTRGA